MSFTVTTPYTPTTMPVRLFGSNPPTSNVIVASLAPRLQLRSIVHSISGFPTDVSAGDPARSFPHVVLMKHAAVVASRSVLALVLGSCVAGSAYASPITVYTSPAIVAGAPPDSP